MKLTVIIPVFNEAQSLVKLFDVLFKTPCPIEREWIVIDDQSTDNSLAILESLALEYNFLLLKQKKNMGKGRAIADAIPHATGDLVVIQDADFEYDPLDINHLLIPFLENKADVVYGSRFRQGAPQVHRTYHYFVNRFLTTLSNLFSGIFLTDMETCYKIFRRDLLQAMCIRSKRFGIEIELTAYIAKTKSRIYELPIAYHPRTKLQGKKINWKDGLAALSHLIYFNFLVSFEKAFKSLPDHYKSNTDIYRYGKKLMST